MANIRRLALVISIASLGGITTALAPGTASACSCASVDPVDAIAYADVVFTGELVATEGTSDVPVWRFAVDGVVKGTVGHGAVVAGEDWAVGCGTDFGRFSGSVTVYARRQEDGLASIGCMPTPSADDLADALERFAQPPTGTGQPAYVMIGRFGTTDIALLDDRGRTIVRRDLGAGAGTHGVAHCPGSTRAVTFVHDGTIDVVIVELSDLTVVDRRPTAVTDWLDESSIACLDGGDRVIVAAGHGPNYGSVHYFTSDAAHLGTSGVDERRTGVTRGLAHPAGTIISLPTQVGAPVTALSATDLTEMQGSGARLPDGASVVDGAISPDGRTLAMLVNLSGRPVEYDTPGTHVVTLDVVDGVPVDGTATTLTLHGPGAAHTIPDTAAPAMPAGPRRIAWAGAETWALEHETSSSKLIEFVGTDGDRLLPPTDVDWGWGMVPAADGVLRVSHGGVETIGVDGSSVPGDPAPRPDNWFDRSFWLGPLTDAPSFTVAGDATAAAPTIRPPSDVEPPDAPAAPPASSASTAVTVDGGSNGPSGRTIVIGVGVIVLTLLGGMVTIRRRSRLAAV